MSWQTSAVQGYGAPCRSPDCLGSLLWPADFVTLLQGCGARYCSRRCLTDDAWDHRVADGDAHRDEYDGHLIEHLMAMNKE